MTTQDPATGHDLRGRARSSSAAPRQAARLLRSVLAYVVVAVVVAAAGTIAVLPRATGGAALTVQSGSMTPTYPVGSLVLVRPVEPVDVRVGDVITYASAEGSSGFTTHRVVRIESDDEGPTFATKGDGNNAEDSTPVAARNLRARVWFGVPRLGTVRDFGSTPTGAATLAALTALLFYGDRLSRLFRRPPRPDGGGARGTTGPVAAPRRQAAVVSVTAAAHDDLVRLVRDYPHEVLPASDEGLSVALLATPEQVDELVAALEGVLAGPADRTSVLTLQAADGRSRVPAASMSAPRADLSPRQP